MKIRKFFLILTMSEFNFGPLTSYIEDDHVTDINYNGHRLWIDDLKKGRYLVEDFEEEEFITQFCFKIANFVNLSFNVGSPLIEAETKDLRISIIHDSIARSGHSISIRKTPSLLRLNDKQMVKDKYADKALIDLLVQCVKSHFNIMVCGLPGVGKTELVKYLSSFIADNERVITIEDTLELRYHDIHPDKDCVAIKVKQSFTYADAIKASLRQRPDWILVSEVRSHEVVHLMESISTGTNLISTIHARNASSIPQRILHMFPDVEIYNDVLLHTIHEAIDLGVLIKSEISMQGVKRYIAQVVAFDCIGNDSITNTLYEKGKKIDFIKALPANLAQRFIPITTKKGKVT
ncbi:MAG: ATPase, T2SS/T4P/T4SS family [Erysipelotrichaceae bacterium]